MIHPDGCIDCGVCVPECPAEAIFPGSDSAAEPQWLRLNQEYADKWPNITRKKDPMPEADTLNGVANKRSEFSPNPGKGGEGSSRPAGSLKITRSQLQRDLQ